MSKALPANKRYGMPTKIICDTHVLLFWANEPKLIINLTVFILKIIGRVVKWRPELIPLGLAFFRESGQTRCNNRRAAL